MIKKDLPPGWSYEDGDPGVGIFGGEFVHEDCTTLAGPGYELRGVKQSEGLLTCEDCGQKVAYEDPDFIGEPDEEVVEPAKPKKKLSKKDKAGVAVDFVILFFVVIFAMGLLRERNWFMFVVALLISVVWSLIIINDWPINDDDEDEKDDNDRSGDVRDIWKNKFHRH